MEGFFRLFLLRGAPFQRGSRWQPHCREGCSWHVQRRQWLQLHRAFASHEGSSGSQYSSPLSICHLCAGPGRRGTRGHRPAPVALFLRVSFASEVSSLPSSCRRSGSSLMGLLDEPWTVSGPSPPWRAFSSPSSPFLLSPFLPSWRWWVRWTSPPEVRLMAGWHLPTFLLKSDLFRKRA